MAEGKRVMIHFIMLFADVALLSAVYGIFPSESSGAAGAQLRRDLWFTAAAGVYIINYFFRRGRMSRRLTFGADILLVGASCAAAAVILQGDPEEISTGYLLMGLFTGGTAIHAAVLPDEKAEEANLPLYADGLLAVLLIQLFADYMKGMEEGASGGLSGAAGAAHTALALLFIMLGLILRRTHSFNPGLFLLPAAAALLAAGAALAAGLLNGISETVIFLLSRLKDLLLFLLRTAGRILWAFLLWFASLFPETAGEYRPGPAEEQLLPKIPEETAESPLPLWVLLTAVVILIVLILFLIMRALKGQYWQGLPEEESTRGVRRKSRLPEAIRAFRDRLLARLRFERLYLKNRNTAAGLLTYAERRGGRKYRRSPGESGPAFLRRLQEELEGEAPAGPPEDLRVYEVLAAVLERRWYGGAAAGEVTAEFCRTFRRRLRGDLSAAGKKAGSVRGNTASSGL